jgi:O-antigen/teichoic acid export membrane protein
LFSVTLSQRILLNTSILAGARLVLAATGVVSIAISTRYLGVEDYGSFVAALAFAALVASLADWGLFTICARELAKRPDKARRLLSNALTLGLVTSLVIGAVGIGVGLLIYHSDSHALTRQGLVLLLLTTPLMAPAGAIGAYFVWQQRAYMTMIGSVAASGVSICALLAATTFDWGFTGIVLAYALNGVIYGLVMMRLGLGKIVFSLWVDLPLWRDLIRWAIPLGAASALNMIYFRIDTVMLSVLAAASQVGLYGVAYKFVEALIVLPSFFLVTLLPELARLDRHSERLERLVQKAFTVMEIAVAPLLVLTTGFATEIVRIVGGPGFDDAAVVLQILMVGLAAAYFTSVFNIVLVSLNQQTKLLLAMLVILPFNVALNFALIPVWGARGAALAFAVSEFVALALSLYFYRGVGYLPGLERGRWVLLAAACMALVVLVKLLPFADSLSPLLVLGLGGLAALAVYTVCLYAFRAMPREVHATLVAPLWMRFRSLRSAI